MVLQPPAAYLAEARGNLQAFVDVFVHQRRYLDGYLRSVRAFSVDDNFESLTWMIAAGLAGEDFVPIYNFREKLVRACKLAEFGLDVNEFRERREQFPMLKGMRESNLTVSSDGLVCVCVCVRVPVMFACTHCASIRAFSRARAPFLALDDSIHAYLRSSFSPPSMLRLIMKCASAICSMTIAR